MDFGTLGPPNIKSMTTSLYMQCQVTCISGEKLMYLELKAKKFAASYDVSYHFGRDRPLKSHGAFYDERSQNVFCETKTRFNSYFFEF